MCKGSTTSETELITASEGHFGVRTIMATMKVFPNQNADNWPLKRTLRNDFKRYDGHFALLKKQTNKQ